MKYKSIVLALLLGAGAMFVSCEKYAMKSFVVGRWVITDYQVFQVSALSVDIGWDNELPKNEQTESYFTEYRKGKYFLFKADGEVSMPGIETPYSYQIKDDVITISLQSSVDGSPYTIKYHFKIDGDRLILYDYSWMDYDYPNEEIRVNIHLILEKE